jgi:hypothetical protein
MEDIIRFHAVVFAAEAGWEEKTVKWEHWWKTKLGEAGIRQKFVARELAGIGANGMLHRV